ncbi:transposase [Lyngbya aestuarii]|uniref:transposase n=1 Tax=Lyngbya aestuarii TaxID=118322 RepID=UPI00403E2BF6
MNPSYLRKKNQTPNMDKREILDGVLYQLKNGCNWCDLPKDLPPYSTVFWHYKQWREQGIIEKIRDILHGQLRQKVKKNHYGQP